MQIRSVRTRVLVPPRDSLTDALRDSSFAPLIWANRKWRRGGRGK